MLLIQVRRNTGELDLPPTFPQTPKGLIELGRALPGIRAQAKAKSIESEVWAETSTGRRIPQEDIDYVLHVEHAERSIQRTRRPDQRRVQRGQGPLNRAA
jgi:hypothetical protein